MSGVMEYGWAVLAAQPFSRLLGAELTRFAPDEVELRLPVREDLKQQNGFVHGGVISYLADNALTFAGGAVLGALVVTVEMKVNYLRPAIGELLIARAIPLGSGRTQAVVRCEVYVILDGAEKLCPAAQGTISLPGHDLSDQGQIQSQAKKRASCDARLRRDAQNPAKRVTRKRASHDGLYPDF